MMRVTSVAALALVTVQRTPERITPMGRRTFAFAITLASLGLCGCGASLGPAGSGETHSVTYSVSGSARQIDVNYYNANGDQSQETGLRMPYTRTLQIESGSFTYISAQNVSGMSGDLTCTISVDGVQKESNTSSGAAAICTASGNLD